MSIPAYVMCRCHALCYRVGSYKTHSESCNCKPKNVAAVNTPLETSYGNKNPIKSVDQNTEHQFIKKIVTFETGNGVGTEHARILQF